MYSSNRLYAQNSVAKVIHEENVKVYSTPHVVVKNRKGSNSVFVQLV